MKDAIITLADQFSGDIGALIAQGQFDPGYARPFIDHKGNHLVTVYKGHGDVMDPRSYRSMIANAGATLREDEWKELDDAVLQASRERIRAFDYLRNLGLTKKVGNAMGTTVYQYQDSNDPLQAIMTMDGITRSQNDAVKYKNVYIPLPIIHVDYELNLRSLSASRKMGAGLDTDLAQKASRRVAEYLERMLFDSAFTYQYGGGSMYSFLNFPDRNLYSLTAAWDATAATGATILADVLAMQTKLSEAKRFGNYVLFVPTAYETVLQEDFKAESDKTIRARLLEITRLQDIIVCDFLTGDNVIMLELTTDTFRILDGLPVSNVQWATEGNMLIRNKVMTIQIPQIRADQNGNCGLVHASA